jgi:hypothetical protein
MCGINEEYCLPHVEQVKDTVGVDAHRAIFRGRVGLVADGVDEAGLGRSLHLHGAGLAIDTVEAVFLIAVVSRVVIFRARSFRWRLVVFIVCGGSGLAGLLDADGGLLLFGVVAVAGRVERQRSSGRRNFDGGIGAYGTSPLAFGCHGCV